MYVFIACAYSTINSKGDIGIYFVSNKTLNNYWITFEKLPLNSAIKSLVIF